VGSAHSFTPVVGLGDSDSTKAHKATPSNFDDMQLVSFRKMPRIFDLDQKRKTLTVDAGSTYSEVCAALSSTGLALPNTASLPQFGVAGAVATGTHGSSGLGKDGRLVRSGLADAVLRMEIVGPDGEIRSLSRGDEGFSASVVSLGCMGMVTSVTLELVDDFDVFQVRRPQIASFSSLNSSNFSLFWTDHFCCLSVLRSRECTAPGRRRRLRAGCRRC